MDIDTSKFAKKADLASLKSDVEKIDVGKLETTPVHLSKLSSVVKNYIVNKTVYDELVEKFKAIQNIDNGDLVKKAN